MSDIYLSLTETPSVVTLSQPVIASSVAATVTVGNTVTVALDANSLSALENVTVTVGAAVSVSNFPSTQTIAGTVTANGGDFVFSESQDTSSAKGVLIGFEDDASTEYRKVTDAQPLPISISAINNTGGFSGSLPVSGTVTASLVDQLYDSGTPVFVAAYMNSPGGTVIPVSQDANAGMPISGTVTANLSAIYSQGQGFVTGGEKLIVAGGWNGGTEEVSAFSVDTDGRLDVNCKNPSGALSTRFGSVTTANTAQITSAVTNTSRKYLLAQNISAGTVTIGIGFSPTTTQGIQLTAGAGLTFDSFCPTGAVFWLGAVTGAAFAILEN